MQRTTLPLYTPNRRTLWVRQELIPCDFCSYFSCPLQYLIDILHASFLTMIFHVLCTVATHLRHGCRIFSNHFTADLLPSLPMKEFWKPIKIWQSCRHEFGAFLFLGHIAALLSHCGSSRRSLRHPSRRDGDTPLPFSTPRCLQQLNQYSQSLVWML